MSNAFVAHIQDRLREEIQRCGMSLAAASRAAGESSPQRLKDVVCGRQKCSADLVAKLMIIGVDGLYVLTGDRTQNASSNLASDETVLIEGYRALDAASKTRLLKSLLSSAAGSAES